MDFIINNWVWFIVGGIIILMTIIGYIADKTDFGRKSFSETEKKKENKKEKVEQIEDVIKEPDVQMALASDAVLTEEEPTVDTEFTMPVFEVPAPMEQNVTSEEDLTVPFGDTSATFNDTQSVSPEIIAEETIVNPMDNNIFEVNESEFTMPSLSRENLNVDYFNVDEPVQNSVQDIITEEPIYVEESENISNDNIELPDLESLLNNNNIKTAIEEDDVWKF